MRIHSRMAISIAVLLVLSAAPFAGARAQTMAGCRSRTVANPPRTVFECDGGLTIEAEAAARIGLVPESGGDSTSKTIELNGGAAFFQFQPGSGKLQIRTPHAIASVRGTVYAVDAAPEKTAVFVVEGRVRVTRLSGRRGVTLRAGRGTEVAPGRRLVSVRWDNARASALLARFGR